MSNYWWTYIILILVLAVLFILSETVWSGFLWINRAIGLLGTVVSFAGVVLALVQIQQTNKQIVTVSATAEATQKAVVENRNEIKRFLSFSDMGHLIEIIKNTQNYIRKNDYGTAVLLMQEIKDDMLRADTEFKDLLKEKDIDIIVLVKTINVDIKSLVDDMMQSKNNGERISTLKPHEIHSNLENAREIIIQIESIIKTQKI